MFNLRSALAFTMVLIASFLASLILLAAAKPMSRRAMVVHETREAPARGFVKSGLAPVAKEIKLRIAMKQNDMVGLEKALYAVSDPTSARTPTDYAPTPQLTYSIPSVRPAPNERRGGRIRQADRRHPGCSERVAGRE